MVAIRAEGSPTVVFGPDSVGSQMRGRSRIATAPGGLSMVLTLATILAIMWSLP